MTNLTGPKIKVCGMRNSKNIEQLVILQPDYIGFILYPKSSRFLGNDYVLKANIPESIQRVGVFVNAKVEELTSWICRLKLDYVQLHGSESPDYCSKLAQMGIKVIKSFGIDENFNFQQLEDFLPYCEYFLFDTKTPIHGGSGCQFDWNLLKAYTLKKPIFLSGGIGPKDAEKIKNDAKLPIYAIDINSKFEIEPGLKEISILSRFIDDYRK